jgi:hypothetical protein
MTGHHRACPGDPESFRTAVLSLSAISGAIDELLDSALSNLAFSPVAPAPARARCAARVPWRALDAPLSGFSVRLQINGGAVAGVVGI